MRMMLIVAFLFGIFACNLSSDFLWPTWGGSITSQQRTPDSTNVYINQDNIASIQEKCKYTKTNGTATYGYITVYVSNTGEYHGVFGDFSGYITNINLDTCTEHWSVNIAQVLGENVEYVTRNGISLFTDPTTQNEGVLFGTPNGGLAGITPNANKYAVALHLNTGGLMWSLPVGNGVYEEMGSIHAMAVDPNGEYAYFGMSSGCNSRDLSGICKFVGRFVKIRIVDVPAIVDTFYTIPNDKWPPIDGPYDRNYYQGASSWNWPAIIGDYVVFGTGNLYSMPNEIEQCMLGGAVPPNSNPIDPCGIDRSDDYVQWRCLEDNIQVSAFNILKRFTSAEDQSFEHIISIPLQGTDVFGMDCGLDAIPYGVPWDDEICYPVIASGADADLAAVAAYTYNNGLYAAAVSKAGMFYSFEIPSGELILAKKLGPWSSLGGGQFSIAVDEAAMIAVAHTTAGTQVYYTVLSDDVAYCGGSIHAIDLVTGRVLYEIPNPWALSGNECLELTLGDTNITKDAYIDFSTVNSGICQRGAVDTENVVKNIDISDIVDVNRTLNVENKATFFAAVTISNNLLYIPSETGDIFIVDLLSGDHVYTLRCDYHTPTPNLPAFGTRRGIRGGVTVVEDRIIYYCGDGTLNSQLIDSNGIIHSMQLPTNIKKIMKKKRTVTSN